MRKPLLPTGFSAAATAKPSRLARWRQTLASGLMVVVEGGAGVAALVGAPLLAVMGKWAAAAVLGALALGIFLRFAARKRPAAPAAARPALAAWQSAAVALLSAAEVALLVEATGLPVRHGQPDFSQWNWLLVLAAFAALYVAQRRWLARRKVPAPSASHPDDTRPT